MNQMIIDPKVQIFEFNHDDWAHKSAELIVEKISHVLTEKPICNIFLPAGKTAEKIYPVLNLLLQNNLSLLSKIRFYMTDERLDALCEDDSNYAFLKSRLGVLQNIGDDRFVRMPDKLNDLDEFKLNAIFPEKSDITLLSFAEDGHFASIFNLSDGINGANKRIFISSSEAHNYKRVSITVDYINSSSYTFLMIHGKVKKLEFDRMRAVRQDYPIQSLDKYIALISE